MAISPYHPKDLFMSEVPGELLSDISRATYAGYKESYEYCQGNYDWHQAHDLLPQMRRITIERNILHVVERFPYAKAESLPNQLHNCYHVLIRCGHVKLTISAVKSPGEMVREATFRKQYARSQYLQLSLLKNNEEEFIPKLNNNLYGILLHKPNNKYPSFPEFMVIRFPDYTLTRYLDEFIDLTKFHKITPQEIIETPRISPRQISKMKDDAR